MSAWGTRLRHVAAALTAITVSLALTGCQGTGSDSAAPPGGSLANQGAKAGAAMTQTAATIESNVEARSKDVPVDTAVSVSVQDGTFEHVKFKARGTKRALDGTYKGGKTRWRADSLLEPGTWYVVASRAVNPDGLVTKSRRAFRTQDLSLDEQTYPSVQPIQNEVVGVGMPVIVQFDIPVKRKAAFERHMSVTAKPATVGSWHWISDQEVHWRPKTYWKSGTKVHVDVDVNGVAAGNGIYGQMSRQVDFTIGRSVIMKADLAADQMRVFLDGSLARTIPITGGKPGYTTRSGTKLIIEKVAVKHMDAATIGIEPGDPDYYDIPDVLYAQRVTYSGEFVHAAPWSTYAQGSYNVSHGCVGMSTDNAAWLFGITHRGDPVVTTGTDRGLEDNNGWTDWNETFREYKKASALD
jgi:lipoprotein-anchoring transpeptidase ErfK/SrfK